MKASRKLLICGTRPVARTLAQPANRTQEAADCEQTATHHSRQREALLDRLADAFEQHVNLEPLLQQP